MKPEISYNLGCIRVHNIYSTKGLKNPSFLGKKLQDIRWKEKDWIPIFMGMTEGRRWFTLTLTLSPQGRGEKDNN